MVAIQSNLANTQNAIDSAKTLVADIQRLTEDNGRLAAENARLTAEYESVRAQIVALAGMLGRAPTNATHGTVPVFQTRSHNGPGARYNADLRKFVAANYLKMTNKQMAKASKAGVSTVAAALRELGLRRPSRTESGELATH